jgi:hypothetical protein
MDQESDHWWGVSVEDQDAATDGDVQGFAAPSLRYADGFEEASVVVGSARENQPQGWRKIHRLGFAHFRI